MLPSGRYALQREEVRKAKSTTCQPGADDKDGHGGRGRDTTQPCTARGRPSRGHLTAGRSERRASCRCSPIEAPPTNSMSARSVRETAHEGEREQRGHAAQPTALNRPTAYGGSDFRQGEAEGGQVGAAVASLAVAE